ncbi:Tigger transposable element-derived protein 6 [Dictyocoela muelleri]|nr:Tigger transposable element-derived protein 6 [Dictyocoela muelleri]
MSNKSFIGEKETSSGYKNNKQRLTLLLTCSFVGEKLNPLIVGKFKSPRCLKGVSIKSLKIEYESSKKACMTRNIFINWLSRLNVEMQNENRKIALLLYNATCHITYEKFSDIEIISLPKNTTSLIQSLDQGIIKSFKDKYKNILVSSFSFNSDLEKKI